MHDNPANAEAPPTLAEQLASLQAQPVGAGRIGRARARLLAWAERATTWGPLGPVAEIGWRTFHRDTSIGGSVLGAALAYRLFIWLLPLAFVLVVGLGIAADSTGEDPSALVADAGVTGFVAQSIASSAELTHGWAAVVGFASALLVLAYQTASLLRASRAVTSLAWRMPVRPLRRPVRATALFLGWILVFTATMTSAAPLRAALSFPLSLVSTLAVYAAVPVLYVVLAWWLLPHAADHWLALVPGGILFGAAMAVIGLFTSLLLFPWLAERQATYGVLGVAAGLLFSFFLFGRAVELAAALNAVLAESGETRGEASET